MSWSVDSVQLFGGRVGQGQGFGKHIQVRQPLKSAWKPYGHLLEQQVGFPPGGTQRKGVVVGG